MKRLFMAWLRSVYGRRGKYSVVVCRHFTHTHIHMCMQRIYLCLYLDINSIYGRIYRINCCDVVKASYIPFNTRYIALFFYYKTILLYTQLQHKLLPFHVLVIKAKNKLCLKTKNLYGTRTQHNKLEIL